MKTKSILSSLIILIALYFGANGCNNNPVNSTQRHYPARTEPDFADASLYAEPGSVIVVDLEHLNSPPDSAFDTDEIGIDAIPIRYSETAEHSFRLDESVAFEMKLVKEGTKEEIFDLTPADPQINITIPAGKYIMIFKSHLTYCTDCAAKSQTIFLQPDRTVSNSGNLDYNPDQLSHFLSTKECIECDLSSANFSNITFHKVTLDKANLSHATFSDVTIDSSNIRNANISYTFFISHLVQTTIIGSDLSGSDLSNSHFSPQRVGGSTFIKTNFESAVMSSILSYANNYQGANFNHAKLNLVNIYRDTVISCDFTNARLISVNFNDCDVSKSIFNSASTSMVTWNDVRAFGTDFCGMDAGRMTIHNIMYDSYTKCRLN